MEILPDARHHTQSEDTWIAGHRTVRGLRCFCRCCPISTPLRLRPDRRRPVWPARQSQTRSRLQKRLGDRRSPTGSPLDAWIEVLQAQEWDRVETRETSWQVTRGRVFCCPLLTVWILACPVWRAFSFVWIEIHKCRRHSWGGQVIKHSRKYRDATLFSSQQTAVLLPSLSICA